MTKKKVIGYKAFNQGLVCRGFKYEVGKTYTEDKDIKLCNRGFHFCENPLDVLGFYDLVSDNGELTEFAIVEATGKVESDDVKSVTDKIVIKSKLDLPGFIKASFDFMWSKNEAAKDVDSGHSSQLATSGDYSQLATSGRSSQLATSGDYSKLATSGRSSQLATSGRSSQLATSGDYSQLATSGRSSQLATSGRSSQLATSGDYSQLATSGDYSQLATSGRSSQLATSGRSSQLATSGDYSQLATSGRSSQLATSGDYSQLATSGDYSKLEVKGKNSVAAAVGPDSKIKAVKGTWITLAEYDNSWNVLCVKSAQVDDKQLKANVWYKLQGGEFVEDK